MIEEINNYLNKHEPDFISGFSLLCKYSRNESLISWIGRKHDSERMLYELKKLNDFPSVTPNPRAEINFTRYGVGLVAGGDDAPKGLSPEIPDEDKEFEKFRVFDDRRHKRSELPEDLQKIYDDIASDYKLRRAYHEKMKMATTDVDRAGLRASILDTQERIIAGWKPIDEFLLNKTKDKVEKEFKESSCRSYISKALNARTISESTAEGVKIRLKALQENNCQISEETIQRLKEKGLISE